MLLHTHIHTYINTYITLSTTFQDIRNEAKFHGTSAVEDLSQVFEYFSDEIDNMSGNKFPPRQILSFSLEATKAARGTYLPYGPNTVVVVYLLYYIHTLYIHT